MRKFFVSVVTAVFFVLLSGLSLSQAADPEPSAYTLDNIYYYLAKGTEASWGGHSLEPQSGVPGQDIEGFTKSLEDIYYYMADAFGNCNATYDEIRASLVKGHYFFCTDTNYWGVQEGVIPTPTPSPAPSPTPWGYPDVVQIGDMYVASWKECTGCAFNGTKDWAAACSWVTGLDWLDKTDWRLPLKDELSTICSYKESLGSYQAYYTWSSTEALTDAWTANFVNCSMNLMDQGVYKFYVRAVRSME